LSAEASASESAGAADLTRWRRLAGDVDELRSTTRDGIPVEPLYPPHPDAASMPDRGAEPWRIVQFVDDADPDAARKQARRDIEGGATGLALRFSESGTGGLPPEAGALRVALEDVDFALVHVRLEPCAQGPELVARFADMVIGQGYAPERAPIAFGLDPVDGVAFGEADARRPFLAAFATLRGRGFEGPIAELDGRPFYEAGASEAQELAAVLAKAAWWLRALAEGGAAPSACLPYLGASLAADCDHLPTTAKFRAARLLWRRLEEACGVSARRLWLHAETGRRMMIAADPHDNLIRTTIAAFAAATGMVDSIAIRPFDSLSGPAGDKSRALARDAQHLMIEEADLHRVADPGLGAGATEALTEALAERAWQEFTTIEREGGIEESLRWGRFQVRIAAVRDLVGAGP
jgi:methylmalonyl-CoA mutase